MFSRRLAGAAALALIAVTAVAGCGEDPPAAAPSAAAGAAPDPDGWPSVVPAAPAGKVGPGSECKDTPVRFDVPDKWTVGYIGSGFGAEFPVAGMPLMCEIDAKPGGIIGFIRVWHGRSTREPKAVLEDYVKQIAPRAVDVRYRPTRIGDLDAWEVWYQRPPDDVSDESQGRAFALSTDGQAVVTGWSALDDADYIAGLPGYVLARNSATPS